MLDIVLSNRFKRDLKLAQKRGFDLSLLNEVVDILASENPLPAKFRDHELIGNYIGFRECHLKPDWLLIYKVETDNLVLMLFRTGTHSDLFSK
ncbi:TPA: type II toxin-antitoxin system mRNA interferase toxin, RelE/StbE family [Streptococcus equi subsp. zooepidemicus]|uniref:Addiction module toxin, RelE/StbE family protein n=1 Tax=Streptococcus equi subsp. zooepidemicus Sz4is TaxID=1381082 RepID=A0AAW3GJT0_STRSZ|nr:putative addiction module toxin, RelE/StbE family protein [Streptococcus equi subsp. zooepidemicus Sz4is]HEL0009253.1 type II toxin-antitoxin system mRNA interferase toxin, RelE/StbE family [Streptococcus equi subsp. zooepidemicus]HEL0011326.1 type II toxin-antitoxin system mRNA interferase toxin, RelE/StbE family [Streptococcus equi subsp. zooepidemicus]HEL0013396.1 type II toxin-antitoxin system mRNA interferase toxin, RelE/StbE family [Streptococcus equi subsp. zooepidemicus]HEL0017504.1 